MAKSCIHSTYWLADRPSFVPSLVVIGGGGKLVQSPAEADLTINEWQTNTETARPGGS